MSEKTNKEEIIEKEEVSGVGVYKLKCPTKIEGEVVTEIPYDLNEINGKTIRNVRTILGKKAYAVALPQFDDVYNAALFAEATGISFDSIEALSAKDFTNIAELVKDFLYGEE